MGDFSEVGSTRLLPKWSIFSPDTAREAGGGGNYAQV